MARRARTRLDDRLDAWALWCDSGCPALLGGGASLLARWMDARGHLTFGGTAPAESYAATQEAAVEAAVVELASVDQLAADVLRLEYRAGWRSVADRRALGAYEPRGLKQMDIALRLGVSLRTYTQRLTLARGHVEQSLKDGMTK